MSYHTKANTCVLWSGPPALLKQVVIDKIKYMQTIKADHGQPFDLTSQYIHKGQPPHHRALEQGEEEADNVPASVLEEDLR